MDDINKYIDEDTKREIAKEVWRDVCEEKFRVDGERIFSNAAYHAVWKEVDAMHNGNTASIIADKVCEVIEGLTEYSVFRRASYGEKSDSVAAQVMDQCARESKWAINEAVQKAISKISKDDIMEIILDGDFSVSVGKR